MAANPPPRPSARQGPFGRVLAAVLGFVFWLFLGLLGNIGIEWIGMSLLWPEEGPKRSLRLLEAELRYLETDFREGLLVRRPARFAADLAGEVHQRIYRRSGLERMVTLAESSAQRAHGGGALFQQQVRHLSGGLRDYALAAVIATQVFAIRLAVLFCAVPVFGLAGLVGATDGMVQRDLRRYGGGRERGQVYHWARGLIYPAFTAPWVLYLAWPTSVRPSFFVLPFAALFGLALRVTIANFKKYL